MFEQQEIENLRRDLRQIFSRTQDGELRDRVWSIVVERSNLYSPRHGIKGDLDNVKMGHAWNRFLSLPRAATAAIIAAILVVFTGTGVALASTKSVPGSALYPVKLSMEDVNINLKLDKKSRIGSIVIVAEYRLHEISDYDGNDISALDLAVDNLEQKVKWIIELRSDKDKTTEDLLENGLFNIRAKILDLINDKNLNSKISERLKEIKNDIDENLSLEKDRNESHNTDDTLKDSDEKTKAIFKGSDIQNTDDQQSDDEKTEQNERSYQEDENEEVKDSTQLDETEDTGESQNYDQEEHDDLNEKNSEDVNQNPDEEQDSSDHVDIEED
ncbi:MAG: hypothetical protein M1371_04750 [Actinobacteria bacterium]|nr:hypothetical protein [Actinomycetota bacterium]